MPVDREGWIRPVRLKNGVDRGFRRRQGRDRSLLESRREACRKEKRVLVPQRDVKKFGETGDHLAARLRFASLQTGEVAGRALCCISEVGLRHAPPLSPSPQQHAERKLMSRHALKLSARPRTKP
jgi:hypothetical protein